MAAFFEYLRNITYYLVFIAIVGVVAPSGRYKKFITLFMGLVLIGIMLQPIQALINTDGIPVTQLFAQIIPESVGGAVAASADSAYNGPDSAAYEKWRYEAIKAAFDEQLHTQLVTLLAQRDYTLTDAVIETSEDFSNITALYLTVTETAKNPTPKPFIRIEPVTLSAGEATDAADENETALKNFLAGFYNMPVDHIYVRIQKTEG